MSVRDSTGNFEREFLSIFKNEDDFSFEVESTVRHKTIEFKPKKTNIIIETFKGGGASSEIVESTKTLLDSALRKGLEAYEFLDISALTLEDLRRKREEIKNLPLGPGKMQLIDQYNVDFIVAGSLVITTTRQFLGLQ